MPAYWWKFVVQAGPPEVPQSRRRCLRSPPPHSSHPGWTNHPSPRRRPRSTADYQHLHVPVNDVSIIIIIIIITSAEEGGYVFGAVCLSVCLSVGLLANLRTDYDEIFWRGRAWLKDQVIQFWWRSGSRFGPGVQSPKSGSAEVCAL